MSTILDMHLRMTLNMVVLTQIVKKDLVGHEHPLLPIGSKYFFTYLMKFRNPVLSGDYRSKQAGR